MPPTVMNRQSLREYATTIGLHPPESMPPAQPNTTIKIELYDAKSFTATVSPLLGSSWNVLLEGYPGTLREDIRGMIRYGAKLGYELSDRLRQQSRRMETNLPMDAAATAHVDEEIKRRLREGMVKRETEGDHVITSPLGAVPKPAVDGIAKWRSIHHLSWPRHSGKGSSVNDGISSEAVTLRLYDLEKLTGELGAGSRRDPANREGRVLWKVDLKDAYRHVVVERNDARLLGYF
jgi:hypothetical protein